MKKMRMTTFESFSNYIDRYKSTLLKRDGNCDLCIVKYKCDHDWKLTVIKSILDSSAEDSRWPYLVRLFKKLPFLLRVVPAVVYHRWGKMEWRLSCPYAAKEIVENLESIKIVYDFIGDEFGKQTYISMLMYRLTFDLSYIKECFCNQPEYFIDDFRNLGIDEVFIDVGACIGDTLQSYLKYNSIPKVYYLYEPDINNLEEVKSFLTSLSDSSFVNIRKYCVYKNSSRVWFIPEAKTKCRGRCHIVESEVDGAIYIDSKCLDDDLDHPPTFIKMDIEGSEKFAISGAREIISKYHPRLAICIYHKVSDFWELPILIKELCPTYNSLTIRQHCDDKFHDTILYVKVKL